MLEFVWLLAATLFIAWGIGLEVLFFIGEHKGINRLITQVMGLSVLFTGLLFVYIAATWN